MMKNQELRKGNKAKLFCSQLFEEQLVNDKMFKKIPTFAQKKKLQIYYDVCIKKVNLDLRLYDGYYPLVRRSLVATKTFRIAIFDFFVFQLNFLIKIRKIKTALFIEDSKKKYVSQMSCMISYRTVCTNQIFVPTDFGGWSYNLTPVHPSVRHCPSVWCFLAFYSKWLQGYSQFLHECRGEQGLSFEPDGFSKKY